MSARTRVHTNSKTGPKWRRATEADFLTDALHVEGVKEVREEFDGFTTEDWWRWIEEAPNDLVVTVCHYWIDSIGGFAEVTSVSIWDEVNSVPLSPHAIPGTEWWLTL